MIDFYGLGDGVLRGMYVVLICYGSENKYMPFPS